MGEQLAALVFGISGTVADILPLWFRIVLILLAAFLLLRQPLHRSLGMTPAMTLGAVCLVGIITAAIWQFGFGGGALAETTKAALPLPASQATHGKNSPIINGPVSAPVIGEQNNYYTQNIHGPRLLTLDRKLKDYLLKNLPDKAIPVEIQFLSGDAHCQKMAIDVAAFLTGHGYQAAITGDFTRMGVPTVGVRVRGTPFTPGTKSIEIGSLNID